MEWTNKKPDKEGIYLRANPPITAIHIEGIQKYEGILWYKRSMINGNIKVEDTQDVWLWFGPIPFPFKGYNRIYDRDKYLKDGESKDNPGKQ